MQTLFIDRSRVSRESEFPVDSNKLLTDVSVSLFAANLNSFVISPFPIAVISGFTSLSFNPHPISDNNSKLQGVIGINMSDNPSILFRASVPDSLIPSNVREEIIGTSGVVTATSLERSAMKFGEILHFFRSSDLRFLS